MAIDLVFGSVSASDKVGYVTTKLQAFLDNWANLPGHGGNADNSTIQSQAAAIATGLPAQDDGVPLAATTNFPTITALQQQAVDLRSKCFINEVNELSPLLAGESLTSAGDFVSYLLQAWGNYSSGTPVLKRTTNMATLYYPATHISITPTGDVTDVTLPATTSTAPTAATPSATARSSPAMVAPTPTAAVTGATGPPLPPAAMNAEKIAAGLVWALPPPYSAIGATLLNMMFPTGSGGIDWQAVFQQFSVLVQDADTITEINTQNGLLNGVLSDINDYSNTVTENTKQTNYNLLEGYFQTVNGIVGVLGVMEGQSQMYQEQALASYLHAACVELAIVQEMADQDPTVAEPIQSLHVTTISQNAQAYATYAGPTLDAIIAGLVATRVAQITEPYASTVIQPIPGSKYTQGVNGYQYKDNATGYTSSFYQSQGKGDGAQTSCQTDRDEYAGMISGEYKAQMYSEAQWITNTIAWWQLLENTPLPQSPYQSS